MPPHAPAEGERSSVRGLVRQYKDVAASLIYERLLDPDSGRLESVALVDPRAEKLDDVQIRSREAHDAYQVKWVSNPSGVTIRSLTTADGGDPSPILQLYGGWTALHAEADRPVSVHWVTNAPPSTAPERGDVVGEGDDRPSPPTMAGFLRDALRPFVEHGTPIPVSWTTTWTFLREAVGAPPEDEFDAFMRAVCLDLAYSPPDPLSTLPDERRRSAHVRTIWSSLLEHVADSERGEALRLPRADLLRITGLDLLLAPISVHDFPPPEVGLIPVSQTTEALDNALAHVSGGYVGLVGSPGSGKSTLLSAYARHRKSRGDSVVEYYAYTSDGDSMSARRVESQAFLQDVVLALHARGVGAFKAVPGPDRLSLLAALSDQLADLGRRFASDGTRTILLVDGLDHVNRQGPAHGFLSDLPGPAQLPDGVVVLVGTQTEQLDHLPAAVRDAISQGAPGHVEISPLNDDDVRAVLSEDPELPELTPQSLDAAVDKVQGHPLALTYLVHGLRDSEPSDVDGVVAEAAQPGELYTRLWRDIEEDHGVCHLLGLIARTPGPADLVWIGSWFQPRAAVSKVFRRFRHMFRREGDDRWHVFHDSFRVFLAGQTARYMPGGWDLELHAELADRACGGPVPHVWTELYHRDAADDSVGVARLAQPHVVRDQFAAFRPPSSIIADLAAASAHAADDADTALLVALTVSSVEISQRRNVLDRYSGDPIAFGLVRYGRPHEAARLARTGRTLHLHPTSALYLAASLSREGLDYDSTQLYDLARPRDLLAHEGPIGRDYDSAKQFRLRAWAAAAPRFEPLGEIAAQIARLKVLAEDLHSNARRHVTNDQEASSRLRRTLFASAGETLVEDKRWDDVEEWITTLVAEAIPVEPDGPDGDWATEERSLAHVEARIAAARAMIQDGARGPAERLLGLLRGASPEAVAWAAGELGVERAVQAAEGLHAVGADPGVILAWLPDLARDPDHHGAWLHRERDAWFRAVRLRLALGEDVPELPIPEPETRMEGFHRFRQAVVSLARWSYRARRGDRQPPEVVKGAIAPLFEAFPNASLTRDFEHPDWEHHSDLVPARAWLYATALSVAAEHGRGARDALLNHLAEDELFLTPVFNDRWPYAPAYWTPDDVFALSRAAFDAGVQSRRVLSLLAPVENYAAGRDDVDSRVETLLNLARTWSDVGVPLEALRVLGRALDLSLGVGYRKDYQLADLARLLGWLLAAGRDRLADEDAARWISQLARVIETSVRGTESRQATVAAEALVGHVFSWRPRLGVALTERFERASIGWEPVVTLEVARAAVQADADAVPLAVSVLVHQVLPKRPQNRGLSNTYPDFTELLVVRAADAGNTSPESVARDLCAHLDRLVEADTLASAPEHWKEGVGRGLRALGLDGVADDLGIPVPAEPATSFAPDDLVLDIDSEDATTWAQLQARVADIGLPAALESDYNERDVAVWGLLIESAAPSLQAGDVLLVAEFVETHGGQWTVDVQTALFDALSELGLHDRAWRIGRQLLQRTRSEYNPWAGDGSLGFRLAMSFTSADPDRARAALLGIIARDAAVQPYTVFPWLGSLLPLLADDPDPAAHWSPIEDYLSAIVTDGEPSVPLEHPDGEDLSGSEGLLRYVLSLTSNSANALRLAPVLLDELDRRPWLVAEAVEEALSGPDEIRRPLLRFIARHAPETPQRFVQLLDALESTYDALPGDLQPTARTGIEAIQHIAGAFRLDLAEIMSYLDGDPDLGE